jgi:hypothetical protein
VICIIFAAGIGCSVIIRPVCALLKFFVMVTCFLVVRTGRYDSVRPIFILLKFFVIEAMCFLCSSIFWLPLRQTSIMVIHFIPVISIRCNVRNTVGSLVYSVQYTFPTLFIDVTFLRKGRTVLTNKLLHIFRMLGYYMDSYKWKGPTSSFNAILFFSFQLCHFVFLKWCGKYLLNETKLI